MLQVQLLIKNGAPVVLEALLRLVLTPEFVRKIGSAKYAVVLLVILVAQAKIMAPHATKISYAPINKYVSQVFHLSIMLIAQKTVSAITTASLCPLAPDLVDYHVFQVQLLIRNGVNAAKEA